MIVYAALRLVVRHDDEADEERCLCGAPHGHPTVRWACTARSSLYARILQQRGAWRDDTHASSRRQWLDRLRAGDGQPHRDAAPRADVQLRLALGASPA